MAMHQPEHPSAETGLAFDAAVRLGDFHLRAAFSVPRAQTLVLVGPSGAGKSTCLALIAGLLRPDTGRIACGADLWADTTAGVHVPPERRRAGMLFQDYALFPHLTVKQNVRYGPRARGLADAAAETTAVAWLERFGIRDLADRPVGQISGGQRQRVALARALAAEPRVLLLDEPFGSLDVATRGVVRTELRAFLADCGLPAVLVTHDPVDALAFGERIAVLEAGAIAQIGARDELVTRPRSAFVAELAGLNLYRAELAAGRGLKEARVADVVFHVLADDRAGPAFLSFTPAEVALADARGPGSPQNVFPGRVVEILPLPDRLRIVLDIGVTLVAEVTREAAAALGVDVGRTMWAAVKATAIRVYD
jgi:molybdate transport system ATP-binding protein